MGEAHSLTGGLPRAKLLRVPYMAGGGRPARLRAPKLELGHADEPLDICNPAVVVRDGGRLPESDEECARCRVLVESTLCATQGRAVGEGTLCAKQGREGQAVPG